MSKQIPFPFFACDASRLLYLDLVVEEAVRVSEAYEALYSRFKELGGTDEQWEGSEAVSRVSSEVSDVGNS